MTTLTEETSFVLNNTETDFTVWNVTAVEEKQVTTSYISEVCPTSCYKFVIQDSFGDGICCSLEDGFGGYTLNFQGEVIASGGYFTDVEEDFSGFKT